MPWKSAGSLWEPVQTIPPAASVQCQLLGSANSHPLPPESHSIMLPFPSVCSLPLPNTSAWRKRGICNSRKPMPCVNEAENSSSPPWGNYLNKFMLLEHKPVCGQQFNQMYKLHFPLQILTLLPPHSDTPVFCNCTINLPETHCLSALEVVFKNTKSWRAILSCEQRKQHDRQGFPTSQV